MDNRDIILKRLDERYGTDRYCFLEYKNAYELLVATILSAQCTDKRVNMVTKHLFKNYPDCYALAKAKLTDLEEEIHELGFFHAKARNLISMANSLVENFGGEVPDNIEDLTSLAGVGRKTANVILGNVYNVPSIVVDTHVKRISRRLGLTKETEPEKVEKDLQKILPKDHWIMYNIQIITFGREICTAQRPNCSECFLQDVCVDRS